MPNAEELSTLAPLVDEGGLEIKIAATFPLAAGHSAFESGTTLDRLTGKTILLVRDDAS